MHRIDFLFVAGVGFTAYAWGGLFYFGLAMVLVSIFFAIVESG